MKYDVDYFIRKFEAIPENEWCEGSLYNEATKQSCALGHCLPDFRYNSMSIISDEASGLMGVLNMTIPINNGKNPHYQQSTPKQRILAALYDIKKMQDGQATIKPPVKVITKYVSVPESISQQAKETILS